MIVRHFFLVTEGKIFVMPSVYCVFGVLNQDNLHCKPKLCSHVLFREKKKEKKEAFSWQLFQTVHICGGFFLFFLRYTDLLEGRPVTGKQGHGELRLSDTLQN